MLDIVYQDAYLMIINKPRGLIVHEGSGVKTRTLEDELALIQKDTTLERQGLVHRLDKNTAGLMIVAKDAKTQELLSAMLKKHDVERTYLGIVEGVMHGKGTIDKNIMRSPRNRTLYITTQSKQGRNAVTHYSVVGNYKKYTLVRFNLETGRTHQIRVHCKSIGRPLVGDPEYNPKSTIARGVGQMLESVEIAFTHPITNKPIKVKIQTTDLFKSIQSKMT